METNGNGEHAILNRLSDVSNDGPLDEKEMSLLTDLAVNVVTSRQQFIERYLDKRKDIDQEVGNKASTDLTPKIYRDLYERESIATRAIEILPKECWKVEPEVYEDEDEDVETPFEKAWKELARELRGGSLFEGNDGNPIWETLSRADMLSGIGHYGVILLGFNDGKPLNTPLPQVTSDTPPRGTDAQYFEPKIWDQQSVKPKSKPRSGLKLLYTRVFDESLAMVTQWETDIRSPRYCQPVMYQITLHDPENPLTGVGAPVSTLDVHWSRIIHVADNLNSSEVIGTPRLKAIYNRIWGLKKILDGDPEGFWRGMIMALSFETHPQLAADGVKINYTRLRSAVERFANTLQRYIATEGMTVKPIVPSVVDPTAHVDKQIEGICIALACPVRIFKGSERGELASSQDEVAWNERLQERRVRYITPRLIIPLVDRLIQVGVLPEPKQYFAVWPELDYLRPLEKVDRAVKMTEAMTKYMASGVDLLITPLDFLTRILGFDKEEAQQMLDSAKKEMEQIEPDIEGLIPGHPIQKDEPAAPVKIKGGEKLVKGDTGDEIADGGPLPKKPVANRRKKSRKLPDHSKNNPLGNARMKRAKRAGGCGANAPGGGGFQKGNTCATGGGAPTAREAAGVTGRLKADATSLALDAHGKYVQIKSGAKATGEGLVDKIQKKLGVGEKEARLQESTFYKRYPHLKKAAEEKRAAAFRKAARDEFPAKAEGVVRQSVGQSLRETAMPGRSKKLARIITDDIIFGKVKREKISKRVEAWGTQGSHNKPFRLSFKTEDSLRRWASNNKAKIHGVSKAKPPSFGKRFKQSMGVRVRGIGRLGETVLSDYTTATVAAIIGIAALRTAERVTGVSTQNKKVKSMDKAVAYFATFFQEELDKGAIKVEHLEYIVQAIEDELGVAELT